MEAPGVVVGCACVESVEMGFSGSRTHFHGYRYLVKRSQRKKVIGTPKNFRRRCVAMRGIWVDHLLNNRYFCLTDKRLYYAKGKPDAPLCTIPVEDILGVEQVDEDTFDMKLVSVFV